MKGVAEFLLKCLELHRRIGLSATCSTPSCEPLVQRKIVLIGYDEGCTPTYPRVMSTLSGLPYRG